MQKEARDVIMIAVDIILIAVFVVIIGYELRAARNLYSYKSTYDGNVEYMNNMSEAYSYFGKEQSVSDVIDFISTYGKIYDYAVIGNNRIISSIPKIDLEKYITVDATYTYTEIDKLTVSKLSELMYIDNLYTVNDLLSGELYNISGLLGGCIPGENGLVEIVSVDRLEEADMIIFKK